MNEPTPTPRLPRRVIAALLVVGTAIGIWQVVVPQFTTPPTPRVAVIHPATPVGEQLRNAAELAHARHPLAGTVELVFYNTGQGRAEGDPLNRQHTETIAADRTIVAVLGGPNSNYAEVSIPILNEAGVALVSSLATAPHLTKAGYRPGAPGVFYPTGRRTFFRTIPSDEVQGQTAAFWAGEAGFEDVYIAYIEDDAYSTGLAGIFMANMAAFGLNRVGVYTFSLETDLDTVTETLVSALREHNPDLLYYPLLSGGRYDELVVTLFQTFPGLTILGGDGMTYETFTADDPALLMNLYATAMPVGPLELASAADFVQAYQDTYGTVPPASTLTTYDAMWAILEAIQAAEPRVSRATVLDSLHNLEQVNGALGTWSFNDAGDIDLLAIRVVQFNNGGWTTVEVID